MPAVDIKIERTRPQVLRPRSPRASWHAGANAVVLLWMALTVAVAIAGDQLPAPRWLLIHVFLLGAVTSAIVTWSEHFAIALLRLQAPPWQWSAARLAALNVGVIAVLVATTLSMPMIAVAGAGIVVAVIGWHVGTLIVGVRRALPGRFTHVIAWYVASGAGLVAGGILGGLLSSGHAGDLGPRLTAAHMHANLLGWVGLAVLGTLFTLWPTVLRTKIDDEAGAVSRHTLRLAVPALTVGVIGLIAGPRWIPAAGLALFAAAAALTLVPFVRTVRRKHPQSAAAWMLAASVAWFVLALAGDVAIVATRPAAEVSAALSPYVPVLLAGFVGQVLIGSLTFLLPVVLGGGPAMVKKTGALLERGWLVRLIAVNGALPLTLVPGAVSTVAWAVLIAGLATFVLLAVGAVAVSRQTRPAPPFAAIVVGAVLTLAAVGVAVGTAGDGDDGRTVPATGTQTIDVTLSGMRVRPGVIRAAEGTVLVLKVTNGDSQRHDLRMATGEHTPMLDGGESATITLPPLARSLEGWCTVAGHRAAGMTLDIEMTSGAGASAASGGTGDSPGAGGSAGAGGSGSADGSHATHGGTGLDLAADMSPGWRPYDAALAPAPAATVHRVELRAVERDIEVAPGVRQRMWTYNGSVPGPTLRGKIGDKFVVTLINDGTMGHSIDFHAGALSPDRPMRTIAPGERLTYEFTAERAGAWLYHCSTMSMMQHIGNGMYGAVVIDPPGLADVDREYVLVQGELYLGAPGGTEQVAKMRAGRPDGWMFNGTAAGYDHAPLTATAGERVRVWVVAAGPGSGTAFHIVGTVFDTVYKEGAYLLKPGSPGGAQVLDLAPAQGGFVETVPAEAGSYSMVDHDMRHAEAGAHGTLKVGD